MRSPKFCFEAFGGSHGLIKGGPTPCALWLSVSLAQEIDINPPSGYTANLYAERQIKEPTVWSRWLGQTRKNTDNLTRQAAAQNLAFCISNEMRCNAVSRLSEKLLLMQSSISDNEGGRRGGEATGRLGRSIQAEIFLLKNCRLYRAVPLPFGLGSTFP